MENVHSLFTGKRPADATQQFANIRLLIDEKIPAHFATEEEQVFPLLRAENQSIHVAQAIAELCQEHVTLLQEAQRLSALLRKRTVNTCTGELWMGLMDFCSAVYRHAVKEDQLFQLFNN